MAKLNGKQTIGKHEIPKEEQEGTITFPACSDGRVTKSIELLPIPGLPHDDRHLLQRNLAPAELVSYWFPSVILSKPDRCEREKILGPPRKISQFFDKNQGDRTSFFLKNERARQRPFDEAL